MFADVTVEISTKNRYDLLAHAIQSILNQTLLPKSIIILDDGDCVDLRTNHIYKCLFQTIERKGISWSVLFGEKRGQVANHIKALNVAKTEYVWRIDDDNVVDCNCLAQLMPLFQDPKVAAVASSVLHPEAAFEENCTSPSMKDVLLKYAIQFANFKGIKECEHLYSTFIVRRSLAKDCYPIDLSPVGHREESTMTYNLFKKGYKLLVNGEAVTWHFRAGYGGIRSFNTPELWDHDEYKFRERLKAWKVEVNDYLIMYNSHAIGDNFILKSLIPEIKKKYPGKKIIISTMYPDVYYDVSKDIEIVGLETGKHLLRGGVERYDAYKLGFDLGGTVGLKDVFRKIYGLSE